MNNSYKLMRQTFISGHNGSTPQEVLALTTIGQLSNLLLVTTLSLFPILTKNQFYWIRLTVEFIIIFMPFVLSVTTLSDYTYTILFTIIILIIVMISLCVTTKPNRKQINVKQILDLNVDHAYHVQSANNLKACLLVGVSVAILAVDFPVFPRRFAKTELYGWGLMDFGVGGFISINGGLSPESRLATVSGYAPLFLIKKTLLSTIPILVLGFQRLAAVKAVEYHEHITEYGVHWNFFFTLAFTKMFSTPFCCLIHSKINIGLMSIIFLVIHQIGLTLYGLSDFIQNDYRDGLIGANKEGIISLFGYISLYLFFVQIGRNLLNRKSDLRLWLKNMANMCLIAIISASVMALSHVYIENISRREANLAFVCWMITIICVLLALEMFIQAIFQICRHLDYFPSDHSLKSELLYSISYSAMLLFLFANLITGSVNYCFHTLYMEGLNALSIIVLYCVANSIFAMVCTYKHIQLKIPIETKKSI